MPIIQLKYHPNKKKNNSKKNNKNHSYVYNTRTWRKLRTYYLSKNPLCEMCKNEGKITLGDDVHHKTPISLGNTREQKIELGYDINNLMTLCKKHHKYIHKND